VKVYTKTGDKGTTALIGGRRVTKNHIRIHAYGSVDELMANVAVVHDHLDNHAIKTQLLTIQDRLMTCATILAADCDDCEVNLPTISPVDIEQLETWMDTMDKELPQLSYFVLPGGDKAGSFCHIARTVCRRCERLSIDVQEQEGGCETVVRYLNRLSDFFFVLGRWVMNEKKVEEIQWKPKV
jgi:cob(I)alamin adenosyltransferase